MGTKFWLQFAISEALDILSAYGMITTQDPNLAQKLQAATASLKDLSNYLLTAGK